MFYIICQIAVAENFMVASRRINKYTPLQNGNAVRVLFPLNQVVPVIYHVAGVEQNFGTAGVCRNPLDERSEYWRVVAGIPYYSERPAVRFAPRMDDHEQ